MTPSRIVATGFGVFLLGVSLLNYVPGVTRPDGTVAGVFALDIGDDVLHFASAAWAAIAAAISTRAAKFFLRAFGAIYLLDGLLGLATGSGYLDLGILRYGIQDQSVGFKIAANFPHIALGTIGVAAGLLLDRHRPFAA